MELCDLTNTLYVKINMIEFLVLSSTFLYFIWVYYKISLWMRKKTKWSTLENIFPAEVEPKSLCFYGVHSEYLSSESSYPLLDSYFKLIPIQEGLYVKIELKYEWPIFIPWKNVEVFKSSKWDKDGYDKYQIYDDGKYLGNLKIDKLISKGMLEYIIYQEYELKIHSI